MEATQWSRLCSRPPLLTTLFFFNLLQSGRAPIASLKPCDEGHSWIFIATSTGATLGFIAWLCPNICNSPPFWNPTYCLLLMDCFSLFSDEIILGEPQIQDTASDLFVYHSLHSSIWNAYYKIIFSPLFSLFFLFFSSFFPLSLFLRHFCRLTILPFSNLALFSTEMFQFCLWEFLMAYYVIIVT